MDHNVEHVAHKIPGGFNLRMSSRVNVTHVTVKQLRVNPYRQK